VGAELHATFSQTRWLNPHLARLQVDQVRWWMLELPRGIEFSLHFIWNDFVVTGQLE
jgi:hypothetical protein